MWIGKTEADAIAQKLQGVQCPSPSTHDFICNLLNTLGVSLECVVINKLEDDIFMQKSF